ncbi:hypothetical protein C4566_00015 [Candidatus Parcubacteria bacterium]|nr:MAG: hypothetical protein C4566_00015 [Candidatus Parcubacteria bacterium]
MQNNGFFMDAGWNRIPLLAIILPFTKVEAMQYEEVEVRFQTEQLPTKGRSEDPDKRDQTKDGKEDPYSAAATVSLDQRIKCVIGEFPFTFVYKTGADRSEAVQVTSRYVASFNAQELATMEIDEAMFYPFFESQETPRGNIVVPNASRSKLPNANNVRQAHRLVLEELDRGSIEYNGVGITDYKVLDKNPDDAVQKAMNDLTLAKLQEEIRFRLGVAAGNEAAAEIQQIMDSFDCSEQVAMFYLINRDRARKSATHWVDGLGNLGNMASAFGEATSGAAPRSSGSRPRSGGSRRRGPDSTT